MAEITLRLSPSDAEFLLVALRRAARGYGAGTTQFDRCNELAGAIGRGVTEAGRPPEKEAGAVYKGSGV